MADFKIEPVVFNEGAPLDPTDLQKLQANITNLSSQILFNQTLDGQKLQPIVDYGQVSIPAIAAVAISAAVPITYNTSFGTVVPTVVATLASTLRAKEQVSIQIVSGNTLTPKVVVGSNLARTGTTLVNWIAIANK
jgi:hypothetical protein